MKTYAITRNEDNTVSATVENGTEARPLTHVKYHSDGFELGYSGSGPADLALSILAEHLGEQVTGGTLRRVPIGDDAPRCWQLHHRFKSYFLSPQHLDKGETWTLDDAEISAWIGEQPR